MTFWVFASEHPGLATLFVLLAFVAFVTPFGLLHAWLTSRPVKFTKGERTVLNQAAVFVRLAAPQYSNNDRERNAEALERMASR